MAAKNNDPQRFDPARHYDGSWAAHLADGHEDFGDVEQALEFIALTGALQQGQRILEIGGGIGKLANALRQGGFNDIVCTDVSAISVQYGNAKYPDLDLRVMDAVDLDFESSTFDRCLSFDLVEHLPDVEAHLKEVCRVLKPAGIYLFQTPNILTNSIHETINARGFGWRVYHPSLQSASGLRKKLVKAGFTDVSFVKMAPTSEYKVSQLPAPLAWIFRQIPWRHLPMFMQIGFWVVARKNKPELSA